MRRLLKALVCAFLIIASPAFAVTDAGDPAISRLWAPGEPDRFTCTVSYIFPRVNERMSWVVSAGHCANAGGVYLKRNADTTMIGVVNWRGVTLGDSRYTEGFNDLAIGTAPDTRDVRKHLWLADAMPKGGSVYIHGFPAGVERISVGYVIPAAASELPGAVLLAVKSGEIEGGSSGSPVLSEDGRLVGILWGIVSAKSVENVGLPGELAPGYDLALVTPVEKLHELMKLIGVKK